jgi:hypothetical protein
VFLPYPVLSHLVISATISHVYEIQPNNRQRILYPG